MADLNPEFIKHLTSLCRIRCSDEEEAELLKDLKKILAYFEQLQEIDTEGVPPCNQVLDDISNVMRDDEVSEIMPREVFLSNTPSHMGGMIKIPPVIKGR